MRGCRCPLSGQVVFTDKEPCLCSASAQSELKGSEGLDGVGGAGRRRKSLKCVTVVSCSVCDSSVTWKGIGKSDIVQHGSAFDNFKISSCRQGPGSWMEGRANWVQTFNPCTARRSQESNQWHEVAGDQFIAKIKLDLTVQLLKFGRQNSKMRLEKKPKVT